MVFNKFNVPITMLSVSSIEPDTSIEFLHVPLNTVYTLRMKHSVP
jgi:hypothetical protein